MDLLKNKISTLGQRHNNIHKKIIIDYWSKNALKTLKLGLLKINFLRKEFSPFSIVFNLIRITEENQLMINEKELHN